jgi:hypothetical protein
MHWRDEVQVALMIELNGWVGSVLVNMKVEFAGVTGS